VLAQLVSLRAKIDALGEPATHA
ncbi:MAG: hypothetical protein QOE50_1628, partial [Sphingomonadales bacterium]|nr:hypothetical protein [Sphingomonadales bacterium]